MAARCPSCGQIVGSDPGESVSEHQFPDGSRKRCPGGTGQAL